MILRKSDWDYFPNAVVHFETKNESFLKLAYVHKKIGIEHWYCCLALTQPELAEVDPHDPTLDLETKAKIVYEMFVNPWYFFREIVRIPQDGADPVRFKISRGSWALLWTFFNNIDVALLLIRQQGKTIVVATLLLYLKRILKNSRTILMTRGSDLRTETISKIKQIRDALPGYCWSAKRTDADNTEIFTYDSRSNKLLTCIAQNSKESALNAGRGITTARLFSDETAFTKFVRIMLPAALAAGTTARQIAENEGIPYGNVFTTTPGKRDEPDGKFVYDMFHGGYFWDEHLMDIPDRDQLIDVINRNSTGDRTLIHAPFTHKQLGMSDLDLYKAMSNAGGTREEQLRDFGLQWTAGSLSSPLTIEEAETVNNSIDTPKHVEVFPNNYVLKWYCTEGEISQVMRSKHVIGIDTSDAVGRDNISLTFVSTDDLGTSASAVVNESNLIVFANWVADIMVKYPETIVVIERKSSAPTIIDSLLLTLPARGVEPTRRIFNQVVQNRDNDDADWKDFQKSTRPRTEKFYELYRKYFGFVTTGTTRKLLYGEVLKNAVKMAGDKVRDKKLAAELLGLVVKDGRIDHKASGNDDCVVSWLLACWFILMGRRLDYYGVSNRLLMKRQHVDSHGGEFDEDAYARDEEVQVKLTKEIDDLCTQIAKNRNPFMKTTLERKLRVKLTKLKLDTSQAATIGELQQLIRNDKLQSRYLQ